MRAPWVQFFNNMKKQHVWAEGPLLYCTALLLERDIAVISLGTLGNNERNPFVVIKGQKGSNHPLLFLANIVDLHFQSLLPDMGATNEERDLLKGVSHLNPTRTINANSSTPLIKKGSFTPQNTISSTSPIKKIRKRAVSLNMSHVAEVGEAAISNIKELVKENRRLHAAVKQLQFQARHCRCSEIVVVVKQEESNIIDMEDDNQSVSDEILAATPL